MILKGQDFIWGFDCFSYKKGVEEVAWVDYFINFQDQQKNEQLRTPTSQSKQHSVVPQDI